MGQEFSALEAAFRNSEFFNKFLEIGHRTILAKKEKQMSKHNELMRKLFSSLLSIAMFALPLAINAQDFGENEPASIRIKDEKVSRSIRDIRNRMFNLEGLPPLSLDEPGVPPRITRQDLFPMPELPIEESDVIVLGTISNIQSYILPGEVGIYTEYYANVAKVLRKKIEWDGSNLTVIHLGGALQMESGKIVRHHLAGQGLPIKLGNDYLMFLRYLPVADCFQVVKLWQVREGVLRPNAKSDIGAARMGRSQFDGKLLEDAISIISK